LARSRSGTLSAHAEPLSQGATRRLAAASRLPADLWVALAIAAAATAMAIGVSGGGIEILGPGGVGLVPNITLQMALTLGGGVLLALACALQAAGRTRVHGLAVTVALFALAGYTALSVSWSVDPANSWIEASRTFAYAATFAGAVALVRLAPQRWRGVVGGVLLATVAISLYALIAEIIPETLNAVATDNEYARLTVPFGYWNAVGVTAALGVVPCLWLAARREGHALLGVLAAPALCVLLVTLMLSYSRGALAAALIGAAFWFVFVPLRLRALPTIVVGVLSAAVVVVWAYREPALTDNYVVLSSRSWAGHRFGLVLAAMLVLAFVAALVWRFVGDRHPLAPARRRQVGIALVVALALVPVAGVGALAESSRGLTGEISHVWGSLTNGSATQATSTPGRLTSAGNDHALYWGYAIDVFNTSPAVGAGAGSYAVAEDRFQTSPALSIYAHSYIFQTLADLGVIGLALSLAVAGAWLFAAVRATGLRRPRATSDASPERIALLTLCAVVLIFTIQSAIDWTWFVPADAVIALLCAGWVAGRGPYYQKISAARRSWRRPTRSPWLLGATAAAIAVAALIAWTQWQPLRSEQATNAGLDAYGNAITELDAGHTTRADRLLAVAQADDQAAISRDPLDITPVGQLGWVYADEYRPALAQATFEREVKLQPSNFQSWYDLADYEVDVAGEREAAYRAYATALYLNPEDGPLKSTFIQLGQKLSS
jgi:tetratricopeptide (TPR) repeat protein